MQTLAYDVQGDPHRALDVMAAVLTGRKFAVTRADDWSGAAELGSKTKGAMLGALSLYVVLDWRLEGAGAADRYRLTVAQRSTGWMGGAIGVKRTNSLLAQLRDEIGSALAGASLLAPPG